MTRIWPILLLSALLPAQQLSIEEERRILQESVSQAGNSPVEFVRAAERHLRKHPESLLRPDLEKAILRAAIDANDHRRILLYGEKVADRTDDTELLDRVARALLESDDPETARRALRYAERLEKAARNEQSLARAQALQARALGNLGETEQAITRARQSYETYATGEAAREAARWELRAGRLQDALEHYADAFAIPDPKVTAENRAHHRQVMGQIYRKLHGSEAGLGDLILRAYDRTAARVKARDARDQAANPNQGARDVFEFVLSGLRGDSVRVADFRGKVLVLDFWATWCAPCRYQHPMIEQIRREYEPESDVAFLSINTDQDRSLVKPFIENLGWSDEVYFEDGLARFYRVTSIPTVMIFNKRGELAARIPGFNPATYVELITGRIEEARNE